MKQQTDLVIPVDFGNSDADGEVRLVTNEAREAISKSGVQLKEGLKVLITDGELTAAASLSKKDGFWVAVVTEWISVNNGDYQTRDTHLFKELVGVLSPNFQQMP